MTQPRSHADLFELLPWYVNGTLDPEARAAVEAALPNSPTLRAELQLLQRVQAAVASEPEPQAAAPPPSGGFDRWRRAWWLTPPRLRWLVGAQTALVAAAGLWLLLPTVPTPEAGFRTLTTATSPAVRGARVQVVFEAGVTEAELRALLLESDLAVVDGPSPVGMYLVESRRAEALDAAALAVRLERGNLVRLAAPVD